MIFSLIPVTLSEKIRSSPITKFTASAISFDNRKDFDKLLASKGRFDISSKISPFVKYRRSAPKNQKLLDFCHPIEQFLHLFLAYYCLV